MKVAKLINNKYIIYSIHELFPNTSFPDVGVPESFLEENYLYKVVESQQYDERTQKHVKLLEPVLKNNIVYTFEILEKTPEEINEEEWQKTRTLRNELLLQSDIYVLSDRWESYTDEQKIAWKNYRQDLRNLPQSVANANNIIWPIKPSVNNNN